MRSAGVRDRLVVSALLLSMGLLGVGCGDEASQSSSGSLEFSQQVIRLEQDTSLALVKADLGQPDSEAEQGDEVALDYGRWQLEFVHGLLSKRSRVRVPTNSRSRKT